MEMGMPGIDETIAGSDYSGHLWVDETGEMGIMKFMRPGSLIFLDTHCF